MVKKRETEGAQFVKWFGPLLVALRELGGSGTPDEVAERIATNLGIPDSVQNELLSTGGPRFRNQVAWARFYLVREGLLDSSKRGVWSLTERGYATQLSDAQARVIFQKWVRFYQEQRQAKSKELEPKSDADSIETSVAPAGYRDTVLQIIKQLPPAGFERLSQRILREAGFVQVHISGRSGDQGIDGYGTLQINPLVSFKVLFQCKRFRDSVGSSVIRDFRGAMQGRADKGIIITTGSFTAEARREASRDGVPPIELIDQDKLVDMLENLELGLKPVTTYEVDTELFKEFDGHDQSSPSSSG